MQAFKNYFIAKSPENDQSAGCGASERKNSGGPSSLRVGTDKKTPVWTSPSSSWGASAAPGSINNDLGTQSRCSTSSQPDCAVPRLPTWSARHIELTDFRAEVMVQNLWQDQLRRVYASGFDVEEGVVLKKGRGDYICAPATLREVSNGFFEMVQQLNVSCAVTVNSPVIKSIMQRIPDTASSLPVSDSLHLQVLPRMQDLPRCHKHHFAAFILEPQKLVVWDDHPETVLLRAETLEQMIVSYIWRKGEDDEGDNQDERAKQLLRISEESSPQRLEEGLVSATRPIMLLSCVIISLALCLLVSCLGLGWRMLSMQTTVDGNYTRLALLVVSPFTVFISMFFFIVIVANIFQVVGPISCVHVNSRNYSGVPPRRVAQSPGELPHVTIQMPVYKEGLGPVIKPTVLSIKSAISTYEMQGGSANIFINDDGMQLISPDNARARRDFYEEHHIGWVARPKHDPKPSDPSKTPFHRRGRFKKASNMNYGLAISNRIEEKLANVQRSGKWTQRDEDVAYKAALREVLEEDRGRTIAEGNIRLGEYILLVDSDTRVPADCLLDAVSEMEVSPEVAIIQYTSGVMNVSTSFFERGVTWFTNMIYTSISFAVAMGDIPPFVGHNAVLRWSALQDAASYTCAQDKCEKFWSESHVSEDFDMALRLQTAGYQLRFAAYTGDGFQEGVSLTVYDELMRWEKYAFGVNELIFHPFRQWPYKGPFTPLFRRFVVSNIALYRKCTMMAYISTYYAIGLAWPLTLVNYFLTGWFFGHYDKYYVDSFAIYFSIIVVFPLYSNICLAILRYRLGEQGLMEALFVNFKWTPLFTIFLGGISLHVSKALLCHFFEIDLQWGATSKEIERCNFLEEVPKIVKSFWGTFVFCLLMTTLMVCGVWVFPRIWRIDDFASIYPLASLVFSHFALPVLLNPALMMFSF